MFRGDLDGIGTIDEDLLMGGRVVGGPCSDAEEIVLRHCEGMANIYK